MSDTTTKTKSEKAPARRDPPPIGPDGGDPHVGAATAVPIEVTVTQEDPRAGAKGSGAARGGVRALPMMTLAAEAATTGGVGLYAATGVIGVVGAAGVLTTVAVAARVAGAAKGRKAKRATVARSAVPGHMRAPRGARVPGAAGGRSGGGGGAKGRASSPGAASGRTGVARTGGPAGGSRSGAAGGGRAMGRGGIGSKLGARGGPPSGGGGFRAGLGAANAAHRLGRGAGAATGPAANGRSGGGRSPLGGSPKGGGKAGSKAGGPTAGSGTGRRGGGQSATGSKSAGAGSGSRAGRNAPGASSIGATATGSGPRRGAGPVTRGALKSAGGVAGRAATSKAGRIARERASGMRAGARKVAPKVARAVGAGLAALGAGVVAGTAGLAVSALGAGVGGLLRWARLGGPGVALGKRPLMWGPRAGLWVWRRLMRKARGSDGSPGRVMTDFPEPTDVGSANNAPVHGAGSDSSGAQQMSIFAVRSEAIRDAYARYSPPTMMAVAAEYNGIPAGIRSAACALYDLATSTANDYPVDPQIAGTLSAVFTLTMEAAGTADEIEPAFAKLHEADLARHETPRNGEAMWNIGEQRAHGESRYQRSHFAASCEEIETAYKRWAPKNMMAVGAEYEGLPTGLESLAAAVRYLAEQSNEAYPVDERIGRMIVDTHTFLVRAISTAQELHPLFRRLHALDISHHEAPRNGPAAESMWDV